MADQERYVAGWRAGFEAAAEFIEREWPDLAKEGNGYNMVDDLRDAGKRMGDTLGEGLTS